MKANVIPAVAVWAYLLSSTLATLPPPIQKVLDATALVITERGSGSGFLVKIGDQNRILITNAHVVEDSADRGSPVRVVFYSGTEKQLQLFADVMALDVERDIASLRLPDVDMPDPLDVFYEVADPGLTDEVLVAGFPYGLALKGQHRNPFVTLTKGRITSIRDFGKLGVKVVQIDAEIHPGNSGGPVFDREGRLIGIASAKLLETKIGFAVKSSEIHDFFKGRLGFHDLTVVTQGVMYIEYDLRIEVIDPVGRIKKPFVSVMNSDSGEVQQVTMMRDGRFLRGRFRVPSESGDNELFEFQLSYIHNGMISKSERIPFWALFSHGRRAVGDDDWFDGQDGVVRTFGASSANEKLAKTVISEPEIETIRYHLPGTWAVDSITVMPDDKSVLVPTGRGRLLLVNIEDGIITRMFEHGDEVHKPTLTSMGVALLIGDPAEVWLLDSHSLEIIKTYPATGVIGIIGNPHASRVVLSTRASATDGARVLDLESGMESPRLPFIMMPEPVPPPIYHDGFRSLSCSLQYAALTPDAKRVIAVHHLRLQLFAIDANGLRLEQASHELNPRVESLSFSANGAYFSVISSGVEQLPDIYKAAGIDSHGIFVFPVHDLSRPVRRYDEAKSAVFHPRDRVMIAHTVTHVIRYDIAGGMKEQYRIGYLGGEFGRFALVLGGTKLVARAQESLLVFTLP